MIKNNRFSAIDLVNFIYWSLMLMFFIIAFPDTEYKLYGSLLLLFLLIFLIFSIKLRSFSSKNKLAKYILLFYPAIFLILVFDSIHTSLPYINPNIYDEALANIDYKILGFYPTVAIEKFISPVLTEIMYYLYLFYFFMPFIILGYLIRKKMYRELDKTILFFLFTFYGSYLLYYLFPALGPRFYQPLIALQKVPLEGLYFTDIIRNTISSLEHNKFDAFPSLHAAVSLSVVIAIAKYKKQWLYFFIPVIIGIFISLIYCRYHYFIDIIGGIVWTLISYLIVEKYFDYFYSKFFKPYFSD